MVGILEKLGERFGAMNRAGRVKVVLSGREAGTVQKIQFIRVILRRDVGRQGGRWCCGVEVCKRGGRGSGEIGRKGVVKV